MAKCASLGLEKSRCQTCTLSRSKICPVPPVPSKRKVEPCKFLSVQKFVRTRVNVALIGWFCDHSSFILLYFVPSRLLRIMPNHCDTRGGYSIRRLSYGVTSCGWDRGVPVLVPYISHGCYKVVDAGG